MIRLFSILPLILLTGFCGFKQHVETVGGPYTATLITKVTNSKSAEGSERTIIRIVYTCNKMGDSVNIYPVDQGAVSAPKGYSIGTNGGFYLISRPIYSTDAADSIRIGFSEADHTILINKTDRYQLHPAYYTWFKQQVQTKHSVMAVLRLLEDNIGDYSIEDALPLLLYTPQAGVDKHILQGMIITKRSQSDEVTDTWKCTYHYNKTGKLDMVKAASGKETRFSKKIIYTGGIVAGIKLYRNIESRQVNNAVITYNAGKKQVIKYTEDTEETGKNLETTLVTTFTKRELANIKKLNISQAEVLSLVK
jgi:hypothetical protein